MKKYIKGLIFLLLVFVLASCKNNKIDDYTLLMYVCGSDLEYDEDYPMDQQYWSASYDLEELLYVDNQPENVNIVVEAGGTKQWKDDTFLDATKLNRFHLSNKEFVMDEQIELASMGDSKTLEDFLVWGFNKYPAKKTALLLWNHGGGHRGVCFDTNFNYDSLTNDEVREALSNSFSKTNKKNKLEWIGYDACMMQLQDVADFNAPYAKYMVASQESVAGDGWIYDWWIDGIYEGLDTISLLRKICNTYIEYNDGIYAEGFYYDSDGDGVEDSYYVNNLQMSILDLTHIEEYKDAWEKMSKELLTILNDNNKEEFLNIIKSTKYFYNVNNYCVFDVLHFLHLLYSTETFDMYDYDTYHTVIYDVLDAYDKVVIYNIAQKEGGMDANGLSFFFYAGDNHKELEHLDSKYSNFKNWNEICKKYGDASLVSNYVEFEK